MCNLLGGHHEICVAALDMAASDRLHPAAIIVARFRTSAMTRRHLRLEAAATVRSYGAGLVAADHGRISTVTGVPMGGTNLVRANQSP